jgi:AbiV family abortive infection protein
MAKKRRARKESDQSELDWIGRNLKIITELLELIGTKPQYRGKLSAKQVADGMNAAARNASRLLKDAEILFEAKRYPSAAALAILAIEEAGKPPILRSLAVANDDKAIKKGWKAYRSHQTKNVLWLFPLYVLSGVRTLAGFRSLFEPDSKHKQRLDELKQAGFYTDCLSKGEWSEPETSIDEMIAQFIMKTARALAKKPQITEREIELWIKHVGPESEEASPKDLKHFWAAMMAEGLATVSVDNIDRFLELEPKS